MSALKRNFRSDVRQELTFVSNQLDHKLTRGPLPQYTWGLGE